MTSTPVAQQLKGKTLVLKVGGSLLESTAVRQNILSQIARLHTAGLRLLLIHGGGGRLTRALQAAGIETRFYQGQRVTDDAAMAVVMRVLGTEINQQLATELQQHGVPVSYGEDTQILHSVPWQEADGSQPLGRVGKITKVHNLPQLGKQVAVIASIAKAATGGGKLGKHNINADWAAAAVAVKFAADYLVFLSDQAGLLAANNQVITELKHTEIQGLIDSGVITDGMIPKTLSMKDSIQHGVRCILLLDGSRPDSLLQRLSGQPSGTSIS